MARRWRPLRAARKYLRAVGPGATTQAAAAFLTRAMAVVAVRRGDCAHPLLLRVPSTDVAAYEQVFIKREYEFRTSAPPRVIVDAGANVGLAAVYFANRFPQARIVAIEPEESNFRLLQDNVRPYPNVVAVRAALWNRDGTIALADPGLGHWGFRAGAAKEPVHQTVPAIALDSLMAQYDLPRIDILKLDIEGAEREVFADTTRWLARVEAMIVELHEHLCPGCERNFYRGSMGFDHEWRRGENIYLSRAGSLLPVEAA